MAVLATSCIILSLKEIKMCYAHVPTAHKDYKCCILQTCTQKMWEIKIWMRMGSKKEEGNKKELSCIMHMCQFPRKNVNVTFYKYILIKNKTSKKQTKSQITELQSQSEIQEFRGCRVSIFLFRTLHLAHTLLLILFLISKS